MRWHRLSILMDKINHLIDKFEYFKVDRNKASTKMQVGIFRTNCMDCLDRTNVVQSLIARVILQKQLIDMKIIEPGEQVDNFSLLEYTFKNVWADNADACSLQYSGTGALKTDFTRYDCCLHDTKCVIHLSRSNRIRIP